MVRHLSAILWYACAVSIGQAIGSWQNSDPLGCAVLALAFGGGAAVIERWADA